MAQLVPIHLPFSAVMCAACAGTETKTRFCVTEHLPGRSDMDATRMGSRPDPHLHRQCQKCGAEWTTLTLERAVERQAEEIAKASAKS